LPVKVKLVVQVKDGIKLPVLQVPVNLAMGQQANPGGGVGEAPNAEPETDRRLGLTTLVAGLALTLAFASGGLWLVRRGAQRTLVILVITGLVAVSTAVVWADVPPFGGRRPLPAVPPAKPALTPIKLPAGIELSDKLILEPMPPGDHLTLILPRSMVTEKEKKAAPREKRGR